MAYEPLEAFYIADDLRQCLMGTLADTDAGAPIDSCTMWGTITWDNCCPGMVRTTVLRQYASSLFPDPTLRPNQCNAYTRATDLRALVLRCSSSPDADGNPPPCSKLENEARVGAADMDALWRAVSCCFGQAESMFDYVIREIAPVGARGACIGTQLLVTVNLSNPCGC